MHKKPIFQFNRRSLAIFVCALIGFLLWITWVDLRTENTELIRLRESGQHRLDIYEISMRDAVARYNDLPFILSVNPHIQAILPQSHPARIMELNRYLETLQTQTGASAIFLLNLRGTAIASSNWQSRFSFVGENYAYRPYFQEAIAKHKGRFYAVGSTSGEPGYFLAQAVLNKQQQVIGVVVLKISLAGLEKSWQQPDEVLFVSDAHQVIFLSSDPALKYHRLHPLNTAARQYISDTRQYGSSPLSPLTLNTRNSCSASTPQVSFSNGASRSGYLHLTRDIPQQKWQIHYFLDTAPIRVNVQKTLIAVSLGYAFILLLILYLVLRRRRTRELYVAQEALKMAHTELEERVAQRTQQLQVANTRLTEQIAERQKAEKELRAAQDDLIQAAKLAVLGQMAAGMTHELNQPLAAMRLLAENAQHFLQKNQYPQAGQNLQHIIELTARMATITQQLRAFSRKTPADPVPASIKHALENTLMLLSPLLKDNTGLIQLYNVSNDSKVFIDEVRFEQVLVNLLHNAIDASKTQPEPRVDVWMEESRDWVTLRICDNGPGIREQDLPHVFDPFFSTKPSGEGLGLGLAISLSIIRDAGGQLEALNRTEGGCEMRILLRKK